MTDELNNEDGLIEKMQKSVGTERSAEYVLNVTECMELIILVRSHKFKEHDPRVSKALSVLHGGTDNPIIRNDMVRVIEKHLIMMEWTLDMQSEHVDELTIELDKQNSMSTRPF